MTYTDKQLTVRVFSSTSDLSLTLTNPASLLQQSVLFHELACSLDEREVSISLRDPCPYQVIMFLTELARDASASQKLPWKKSWYELSYKWSVNSYYHRFTDAETSEFEEVHLDDVCKRRRNHLVSGF